MNCPSRPRQTHSYTDSYAAITLRTSMLALFYPTAEYCAPVWCCSAHTHIIDPVINNAWRIVTGCLYPTPAGNPPILAGIQPAELHCNGATLSPARRAMEPQRLLHPGLTGPSTANAWCLKLSHPFVPAAQQIINSSDNNKSVASWVVYRRNVEWLDNTNRLCTLIPDPGTHPPGMALPKSACVCFNRLHTSVRRFRSCPHKSGITPFTTCECGPEKETVDHKHYPFHQPLHGLQDLTVLHDETIEQLLKTCTKTKSRQVVDSND